MTYIIGEIGQNHNGSVDVAKLIVDFASRRIVDKLFDLNLPKLNAVKLTKRDLSEELTDSKMMEPYDNVNSFGATYGEHRAFLELSDQEHFQVYKYARSLGLEFVETICSIKAMSVLKLFTPNFLKVASRDLTNLPLLQALAGTKIPMIVSTGMAGKKELDIAINVITKYNTNLSILHCVSEYPTHPDNVNLNSIDYLIENYPEYPIGYSDHTVGISAAIAAVSKGAKIIEKHITINRDMKGSDQRGSLGIDGLQRMVRDIRLLERSLGEKKLFIAGSTHKTKIKLERSIATNKNLGKGHIIEESDIHLLSPGDGFKWIDKDKVVGKKLSEAILKNEIIYPNVLEK
jgi:sialic acid synthase SpsE